MNYHYRRGTDRRLRFKRLRVVSSGVLIIGVVSSSILIPFKGNEASSMPKKRQSAVQPLEKESQVLAAPVTSEQYGICGRAETHEGLERSTLSQLRKLAEYEAVCGGIVAQRTSFFTSLPTTTAEAVAQAIDMEQQLKEYARFGISPIIFLEPTYADGGTVSIATYSAGGYDRALDTYFAALKSKGITDSQMGMWVPLPEWNTPAWGNTDPTTFGSLFTRTVHIQKKHFPASQAGILLEGMTYPSGQSWENGRYTSFLPYIKGLPRGLVDSFGIQGFPWGAEDGGEANLDPKTYLPVQLAIEAAQSLDAKRVWFNTGTFHSFVRDPAQPQVLTPAQRRSILQAVINQAKQVTNAGLEAAVHLFAEDKSKTDEKIDWSYWSTGNTKDSPDVQVFRDFANDARAANVALWLFDDSQQI
jgi:hypothetical protein